MGNVFLEFFGKFLGSFIVRYCLYRYRCYSQKQNLQIKYMLKGGLFNCFIWYSLDFLKMIDFVLERIWQFFSFGGWICYQYYGEYLEDYWRRVVFGACWNVLKKLSFYIKRRMRWQLWWR